MSFQGASELVRTTWYVCLAPVTFLGNHLGVAVPPHVLADGHPIGLAR